MGMDGLTEEGSGGRCSGPAQDVAEMLVTREFRRPCMHLGCSPTVAQQDKATREAPPSLSLDSSSELDSRRDPGHVGEREGAGENGSGWPATSPDRYDGMRNASCCCQLRRRLPDGPCMHALAIS